METLAIRGGAKTRTKKFPAYNVIGQEEKDALGNVVDSGVLSAYLGAWHKKFNGGKQVCALEEEWAAYFGSKHAIAVNSNTSGLIASLGAFGLSPGDEVIVSPYSMSISASAPLFYGAIPVFVDISLPTYNIDCSQLEDALSPKTKAVMLAHTLGNPFDLKAVKGFCEHHNLWLIEDNCDALGSKYFIDDEWNT